MPASDPDVGADAAESGADPPPTTEPSRADPSPRPDTAAGVDSDPDPDADADADAAVDHHPDPDASGAAQAAAQADADDPPAYDGWYRWGRAVLYAEMVAAVLVTVFSLYLAFTGTAGFLT
jgi:hypothetical protein